MKIERKDVLDYEEYGRNRESINSDVVKLESKRRLTTETFSFLFEDKQIVLNQINEMVYLERIRDEEEIQKLIDIYSEQLPQRFTLSVTMFIEFPDESVMVKSMKKMAGIENSVYLTFDGSELKAIPEEGRSTEALESTLQYLKFQFTPEEAEKFKDSSNVYIETRHPGYEEAAKIPGSLLDDLKEELFKQ